MKKQIFKSVTRIFCLFLIVNCQLLPQLCRTNCFSQNIGINTTGAAPNAKAMLDIDAGANNLGLLIPRLTTTQRNDIGAGASENGLLIFNTTTQCFEAWNAPTSTWVAFGCIGCQLPGSFSATAASGITTTAFDANWTASSDATTYYFDVATDIGFTSFVPGYINLNVGNVTTYNVTGLTCGTTYYYRLRANNACGTSANSSTITVITVASPGSQTFSYTGAQQTWVVPACVISITVDVKGSIGGGLGAGKGARVQTTLSVTPGQTLYIYVGGTSYDCSPPNYTECGGWNGGGKGGSSINGNGYGGGGASDIRQGGTALGNRIVVAGGGGGATGNSNNGGDGGQNGGAGGPGANGGGGGTQGSGGAGGCCTGNSGGAGISGQGGNGGDGSGTGGGGGGGGGYYGGGGGDGTGGGGLPYGGSGGGGSSWTSGTSTTYTSGYQNAAGQIIITW